MRDFIKWFYEEITGVPLGSEDAQSYLDDYKKIVKGKKNAARPPVRTS